jgi:uncharacterized membrane protein YdjX (TVP38/TMEM64 family)
MRRHTIVALAALLLVLYAVGQVVRSQLGIELSPDSIRDAVAAMGWKAPAIFLGLLTFRQFLLLPAIVLLPVGGMCFGAGIGTLLGASGILLSALLTFGMARVAGAQWLQALLADRGAWVATAIERAGPAIVGLVTAHPTGPMSAAFWGAGFSSMALLPFTLAVALGGSVRALAYSFFGSTIPEAGSVEFYVASGILAAIAIAPLAHPGVRARLRRLGDSEAPVVEATAEVIADASEDREERAER